ncbi:hypothetical protein [Methylotenera sp.]|nr:hypothetical protein [Methylotenera sp.]MDP1522893.1 hypothetical protein [Methylotenera sp.]MDP2071506.1 hypothetical protein [Methylotenera sp.]MDP3004971.1 hypothetical protein [Methylotenera sp.]MDP3819592.1 hypothetical protein [Methylotenera sp.]
MMLAILMPLSQLHAGDVTTALLKQAQSSEILKSTNVELTTINDRRYLISVGVADLKDGQKKSKLNAIRTSKLSAEEGAIKFFEGSKITTQEHSKVAQSNNERNDSYQSIQSEHAGADTGVYIYLGEWVNDNFYYTAIAYPL